MEGGKLHAHHTTEGAEEPPPSPPVRVIDDPPVNPLLQDLKVGRAGSLGQVEAELLCLAVTRVVEAPVVQEAQGGSPDTFAFIHRGGCEGR